MDVKAALTSVILLLAAPPLHAQPIAYAASGSDPVLAHQVHEALQLGLPDVAAGLLEGTLGAEIVDVTGLLGQALGRHPA